MNFQKTEEDTLPNMFNGASIITLIPKPNKKITKKEITSHPCSRTYIQILSKVLTR